MVSIWFPYVSIKMGGHPVVILQFRHGILSEIIFGYPHDELETPQWKKDIFVESAPSFVEFCW